MKPSNVNSCLWTDLEQRVVLDRSPSSSMRLPPVLKARNTSGFTLLELIIVVAVIGILATIVMPQLLRTPQKTKEAVLRTDLRTMRDVIDQYYADKGRYPTSLDVLVEDRYLREVPVDPITRSNATWILVPEEDASTDDPSDSAAEPPGIMDVRSGAPGETLGGIPYGDL